MYRRLEAFGRGRLTAEALANNRRIAVRPKAEKMPGRRTIARRVRLVAADSDEFGTVEEDCTWEEDGGLDEAWEVEWVEVWFESEVEVSKAFSSLAPSGLLMFGECISLGESGLESAHNG
jgi:hypothetical protein